jgi:hypothetical protein
VDHITHQEYCKGCSGGLIFTPGVSGSSMTSGSGGFAVPSTLRDFALAKRAVMASRLGIFL